MTVAAYIRVSTDDQNVAGQKAELRQYCESHGITDVKFFEDTGSGKNTDRPALKALQAAIFAGEVKTVLISRLDRLSRKLKDGVNILTDWLDAGLRVVAVKQQHDLSGTSGRLVAGVLLSVAEYERATTLERQAAGIAAAKAKGGLYNGRAKGATKPGVNPAEALDLHRKGLKSAQAARAMGVSRATYYRYLKACQS